MILAAKLVLNCHELRSNLGSRMNPVLSATLVSVLTGLGGLLPVAADGAEDSPAVAQANQWRAEHRIIDLHQHIGATSQHLARAIKIMDAAGVGIGVNLTAGTVTPGKDGGPSEFEREKQLADTLYTGRFLHYVNLDYAGWDRPDLS